MVSTAAFHARVRGSVPGLGGLKETKMFLPHPRVKVSIVGSLRDREVACSASDRQGSNFESCVWRTVSSQSSHHPQEVLLAQFSLYVHKGGLKPDSFHFIFQLGVRSRKNAAQYRGACLRCWAKHTPALGFCILFLTWVSLSRRCNHVHDKAAKDSSKKLFLLTIIYYTQRLSSSNFYLYNFLSFAWNFNTLTYCRKYFVQFLSSY